MRSLSSLPRRRCVDGPARSQGVPFFDFVAPRITTGRGVINSAGLDFYDRLVDALLDARIQPFVTLYHWDLAQALQDEGGWGNRDTCGYFADYAALMVRRLGDRVSKWTTFNEPLVVFHATFSCPLSAGRAVCHSRREDAAR